MLQRNKLYSETASMDSRRQNITRPSPSARRSDADWPLCALLMLPALLFWQAPVQAELRWDWGGFISQGWSLSDDNAFYGDSSDAGGSWDYRELGLNGFLEFSPRFKINGQLLARKAGNTSESSPQVDYLFADGVLMQRLNQQAGIRVGRIKNSLGFFNETRDVAFTRPGIIMPQSIYFDQVRELLLSSDGAALYYRHTSPLGALFVDAQHGYLQAGSNSEALLLGGDQPGSFEDSQINIARILFEPDGEQWRVGLSAVNANLPYIPGSPDRISRGEIDIKMTVLSAQYNLEHWSFTAEALRTKTHWVNLNLPIEDRRTLEAYYVQVDHRLNDRWQVMARFDDLTLNNKDPDGKGFSQLTGLPGHLQFANDWTLGVRYQPSMRWDLRAEVHRVDGTAWLSKRDNEDLRALQQHWNLLLLQAAWRF